MYYPYHPVKCGASLGEPTGANAPAKALPEPARVDFVPS